MAKKKCAYCVYLDLNDKKNGQLKCEKDSTYRFADSEDAEDCRKYCERWRMDMGKAEKAIKEAEDYRKNNSSYTSVGCFITTAVVDILGMKDDCPLLQTLRFLRGYYMQNDSQYREILMKYDVVGPILALALANDENRIQVASDILICLQNATRLVAHEKMEAAIALYVDMTENLMKLYAPSYVIGEVAEQNYDQTKGGHGAFQMKRR